MDRDARRLPRLLLVTDDPGLAGRLSAQLRRLEYDPAVAVCGAQALDLVPRLGVELVLVDSRLPYFSEGLETVRLLGECLSIPSILIVDQADRETLARLGPTDVRGCLVEPSGDAQVVAVVEIALQQLRRERQRLSGDHWMTVTLDQLDEGLILTDADGCIRRINPVARRLLGVEQAAVLERPLDEVYHVQPEMADAASAEPGDRQVGLLARTDGGPVLVEHMATPILDAGGGLCGTMVVFRDIERRRRDELALRQSVDNLRRTLEQAVNALSVTSEIRDPFTAGHQKGVSRLAEAIATEMGLSSERREGIRIAGLVHDIGKVHVPTEILAKPAGLTPLEVGIVQGHCVVGYEILKDVPFPWPVARMVLEHHERLDGSGYPKGLSGPVTLLESRILAVADVVEAMISHRPYRASLRLDQAMDEIRQGRGTRYDADVVDACLRLGASDRIPL